MKTWNKYIEEKSLFTNVKKKDAQVAIKPTLNRLHNITSDIASAVQQYHKDSNHYLTKRTTWFKAFEKGDKSIIKDFILYTPKLKLLLIY